MRVNLKGLHFVNVKLADGTSARYTYAWRGGKRLFHKIGTPEFIAEYNEAVRERAPAKNGTLLAVIWAYQKSPEFNQLGARTKRDYLRMLAKIEDDFSSFPLSAAKDPRTRAIFKTWRDKIAERSLRQADYHWTFIGRLFAFAVDRGMCDFNPCTRGGRLYRAARQDNIWLPEDEAAFYASAPVHLHLALTLALYTGQRQGDLLRLTWAAYDGSTIRLQQGKTRRRVAVKVAAPLKAALDSAKKGEGRGLFVLQNMDGKPWTSDGFRSSWGKACAKAGIENLTFHDLRGTAITRLAAAGCSPLEIASITGHDAGHIDAILKNHYLASDSGLSTTAILKLEAFENKR